MVHSVLVPGEVNHTNPITAYSVEGTPSDSAILALEELVGEVDLVVSGINAGSNLGWDVMVSGTVGAAIQGYMRGYPTIAISVASIKNPQFGAAATLLAIVGKRLVDNSSLIPCLLNINVPSISLNQLKGIEITKLGGRSYGESVRNDTTGIHNKYWISRNRPIHQDDGQGTDMYAVRNNAISITPLHLGLTDSGNISSLETLLSGISEELNEST
tara:strand:+ start:2636 stop:3280 length:645 start_codon:yes stop_codon:yes gene_type:complete